jgi:hypothetical protein
MSIELFCYSTLNRFDTDALISNLRFANDARFTDKFILYSAREAGEVGKEIAAEFGFVASATFLVALNNKSAAGEVGTVVDLIKETFGIDLVLVLFANEIRM